MVKIKQKKTMNLPQLVAWSMENGITNKWYRAIDDTEYISEVFFNESGLPLFSSTADKSDTFTIEIDEEITEDTELDLVERFIVNNKTYYTNPQKMSINTCLENVPYNTIATHFYIESDNRELVLIWRDGRLIE